MNKGSCRKSPKSGKRKRLALGSWISIMVSAVLLIALLFRRFLWERLCRRDFQERLPLPLSTG